MGRHVRASTRMLLRVKVRQLTRPRPAGSLPNPYAPQANGAQCPLPSLTDLGRDFVFPISSGLATQGVTGASYLSTGPLNVLNRCPPRRSI